MTNVVNVWWLVRSQWWRRQQRWGRPALLLWHPPDDGPQLHAQAGRGPRLGGHPGGLPEGPLPVPDPGHQHLQPVTQRPLPHRRHPHWRHHHPLHQQHTTGEWAQWQRGHLHHDWWGSRLRQWWWARHGGVWEWRRWRRHERQWSQVGGKLVPISSSGHGSQQDSHPPARLVGWLLLSSWRFVKFLWVICSWGSGGKGLPSEEKKNTLCSVFAF